MYARHERAFLNALTEQQYEALDRWSQGTGTMKDLAESLTPEQEPLMLVWAMRLVVLIEETIRAKASACP